MYYAKVRVVPKIFLASSLVIVVLLGVGALSLRAVGRLHTAQCPGVIVRHRRMRSGVEPRRAGMVRCEVRVTG